MNELTLSQKKQYLNNNEKELKTITLIIQDNNYKKYSGKNDFNTLYVKNTDITNNNSEFHILQFNNDSNTLLKNALNKLCKVIETEEKHKYSLQELKEKKDFVNVNNAFTFKLIDNSLNIKLDNYKINNELILTNNEFRNINLIFSVIDFGNSIELTVEYNENVYYNYLIKNILNSYFEFTLNCVKDNNNNNINLNSIEYIPIDEKNRIIYKFNDNKIEYTSGNEFYHSKFAEISKIYPDKCAIIFENKKYTYSQINSMSNSLACYLRKFGIKRNEIIPIICERSSYYIIAFLAVMKAGAAFVYIDPEFPIDRIKYLTNEDENILNVDDGELLEYNLERHNYDENTSDLQNINQWNDLCYLFFTSGTTGKPKGTMVTHDSLIHYCLCTQMKNNGTQDIYMYNYENILGFTKFTYAMTIIELFHTLIKSKTIILCNTDEYNNSELLGCIITKYNIDYIVCTPSRIKKYLFDNKFRASIKNVKYFNFGGEMVTLGFLKDLRKYTDAILYNGYGLSEATAFSAVTSINLDDNENEAIVTIGKPACNYDIFILDEDLNVLPVGVEGEICISSYSISIGYLNMEKITNEKFIECPFNQNKKMYRTGDIGKWTNDGRIVYSGRKDFQVKINGQRIELGEIESAIKEIEGIDFVTVLDKTNEKTNDKYLVAYYITQNKYLNAIDIRNYLEKKLPKYMIPKFFMKIKEIPFNVNGKLDRKALPDPDINNNIVITEYKKPETLTEKKICKLYSLFFNINESKIGRNANFFELGGDSLNVITLLHKIEEEFEIKMNVKDILKHSVIKDLCQYIDNMKNNSYPSNSIKDNMDINMNSTHNDNKDGKNGEEEKIIKKRNLNEFPVTSQQLGIYIDSIKNGESTTYNNPYCFKLPKNTDIECIKQAFKELFKNHNILKSRYFEKEIDNKVEVYGYIDDECELEFENYSYENVKSFIRPFNLSQSPLIRVGFLKTDYLLIDIHHIICDGTTLSIIKDEINYYYQNGHKLNELEIQFSDYAHYIYDKKEKGIYKNQVDFYKKLFNETDYTILNLPKKLNNKINGRKNKSSGKDIDRVNTKETIQKEIQHSISKSIDSFMKIHGISKTAFFISIYGYILSKYSGQDIVYSTLISSNRNSHLIENMIGMFVTTLPILLKYENCDKYSLLDIIKRNMDVLMDVYINQDISLSEVSKLLNLKTPNNLFAFQPAKIFKNDDPFNNSILNEEANDIFLTEEKEKMGQFEMSKFDMVFSVIEEKDNYLVNIEYNSELYDHQMIEKIIDSYIQVVSNFKSFETTFAKDVEYISEEEKTMIIKSFNNNSYEYNCNGIYHVEFSKVAKENGNKCALICNNTKFTFKDVEEMSNSIAYHLRENNVGRRNDIIPIVSERSHYYVIAALGILKSGAAFLPIDPDFPKDRIKYMMKETNSKYILKYITNKTNDQKIEEIIEEINRERENLSSNNNGDSINTQNNNNITSYSLQYHNYRLNTQSIENINQGDDLCYTIFTSGTTGKPKGTLISHSNLINFCFYSQTNNGKEIYTNDFSTSLASAKLTFDMSISEIFYPLVRNKCVVICNDNEYNDPQIIGEIMLNYGVDYIIITPSRIENYSKEKTYRKALKNLKCILVGGEECKITTLENIMKVSDANVYNLYGPTEITVSCSMLELSKFYKDNKNNINEIPIGKPNCNNKVYILDKYRKPVPIGVEGEIYIGGYGVGKGYLNREELTKEKFVENPFNYNDDPHNRVMYRAGDLGKWTPKGEINYYGRIDFQVKINGQRIELGEIESTIKEMEAIDHCVVIDKKKENGDQYLICYYISSNSDDTTLNGTTIRKYLNEKLPRYMIPNYYKQIHEIPLSNNGKLNKEALPEPTKEDFIIEKYIAPETDIERMICKFYSKIFNIPVNEIGRMSDFYELGGDSLNFIHFSSLIEKELNIKIHYKDMISHSMVVDLGHYIEEIIMDTNSNTNSNHKIEIIKKRNCKEFPVTSQQLGIYIESVKNPNSIIYNIPNVYKYVNKNINITKIIEGFKKIFENQEVFKTRYGEKEVNGKTEIYGFIDDECLLTFEEYTFENIETFVRPFDLSKAPLIRVGFVGNELLLVDIHHIISDGVSFKIIQNELNHYYYEGECQPLEIQFSDYAIDLYERRNNGYFESQIKFYKDIFSNEYEVLTIPGKEKTHSSTEETKKDEYKNNKKDSYHCQQYIDSSTSQKINEYIKHNNVSKTAFFISIYGYVLSKYSGQEIIYTSVISANRNNHYVENMSGMFVSTLPLLLKFNNENENSSFKVIIQDNMKLLIDIYNNQNVSLSELTNQLKLKKLNNSFVYQPKSISENATKNNKCAIRLFNDDDHDAFSILGNKNDLNKEIGTKFDITFNVIENDENYLVNINYNDDIYDSGTINNILYSFMEVIKNINSFENNTIKNIEYIPEKEREMIINKFNANMEISGGNKFYYKEISNMAKQYPDKYAIIFNEMNITYKELDEMSNSLAHYLRRKGVQRNDIIPIISDRSPYYIISVIAISKAGGAYLPVDIKFPIDRIQYILEEVKPKVILTNNAQNVIKHFDNKYLVYDIKKHNFSENGESISYINDLEDLCYVLFTSGTTGKPKGTLITHFNIYNYVRSFSNPNNMNIYNIFKNNHIEKVLAISNFAFDISQTEITLSLVNGWTVVLMDNIIDDDSDLFVERLIKNNIKLIKTTPTRFKLFLENNNFKKYLANVNVLIFGGEEFKLDLYNEIRKYSNCSVYNGYGPTECTVACTFTKVDIEKEKKKITIGEPITNCPVYILDKYKKPVPVGVEGEIYIGGYGVGKGYLNREELTKEKFVANPFNYNDDPHNRIIYRTGDLGKWTSDGEVDYIGRIDFQVKINGQRIELGEIENTIKEINGIDHCVVIDKKKENGDQYLICYYISSNSNDTTLNGSTIRKYLNEKLPRYMIPNYYKRIDEIPLSSSSGKLNRKALPEPTKEDFITEKYVAPETDIERMICKFYSKIFNIPVNEIGRMSDFYELGGDSLNVIRFSALIENELNIKLHFKDIMSHSVIVDLAKYIEKKLIDGKIKENVIDYAADVEILDDPKQFSKDSLPTFKFPGKNGNLFLTGVTGFLGSNILATYLRKNPAAKVYCLVRANSDEKAFERIKKSGLAYMTWNEDWERNHNVVAVRGDLSQENFGIDNNKWDQLCKEVHLIIHNGAMVHWMYPYEKVRNVNVLSTVQCLKMATTNYLKSFYFISSVSSLSTLHYLQNGDIMEDDDIEGARTGLDSGYGQSKWVSEKLVLNSIERGVPACIIRPGFILGNSKNGVLNTDDFVTRMMIDCIQLKQYPNLPNPINACPVDYVAGAIIQITSQKQCLQHHAYHISHNPKIYYNDIFEELKLYGYDVKNVDYEEWRNSLTNLVQVSANKNALFPLLPFVLNDLPNNTKTPTFNDNNTRSAIKNSDVPIVNVKEIVGKYLAYLIKIGLINPPTDKNATKKIPNIGELAVTETIGRHNLLFDNNNSDKNKTKEIKKQSTNKINNHNNTNVRHFMKNDINDKITNVELSYGSNNINNNDNIIKDNNSNKNINSNNVKSKNYNNQYNKINQKIVMELNNDIDIDNINNDNRKNNNTNSNNNSKNSRIISKTSNKNNINNIFKIKINKIFTVFQSCFPAGHK
ncbi:hypothetical protein PIROE2DRAFT_6786 [Piromyces sp. E2]|nr:hypothetical protein PIROE2DRAFT_6786 [Piromyces sp. E2]|eukprot:OUM66075.1 hypothetical protein PIROE2DRAFT_6786 [Piromyces sp. E2]